MSERPADLHSELRGVAAEDFAAAGAHPPPEDLIAYHEGSLPEPRAEELREHLAVCGECTALLLDFDEHWADGAETAAEAETAYEPWHRRAGPLRALAAGLAVAVGLAGWMALQRTQRPGAEWAYQTDNLEPDGETPRSGRAEPIQIPATAGSVVLNLTADAIAGSAAEAVYVATLRFGDETVATVEGTLDDAEQFTLTVPRRMLHPGEWRIELRGPEGTQGATYSFSIVPPDEPGAER